MSNYPPGSTPPGGSPDPKSRSNAVVIAIVVTAVIGVLILIALAGTGLFSLIGLGDSANLKAPPSLRREQSLPREDQTAPLGTQPSRGEDQDFQEVSCVFSGTSSLSPGISASLLAAPSVQKMELESGSSFRCTDEYGESSGQVSLSAKFPRLSAFRGAGAGPGRIEWKKLPANAPGTGATGSVDHPLESTTRSEVELILPDIIVWISILDGPYVGLQGKLVLRNWELIKDTDGTIVGIRFQPTDFLLAVP